jgi:feruloyl esterase
MNTSGILIALLGLTVAASQASAATCESLRTFAIGMGMVTGADVVPAGPFVQPARGGANRGGNRGGGPAGVRAGAAAGDTQAGAQARGRGQGGRGQGGRGQAAAPVLPEHCRVRMTLTPTSDSNIQAELWMPAQGWNGKFMAVGNGGFGGSIQGYGEMAAHLALGYATAGNDTGHSAADGPGGMFALGHPEKIVDFAYRAMHEMTATSKRVIDEFYGRAPQFSYYKGCSTGGRQGVMAAQRYPGDFDAIIAGALANRHIQMHTAGVARSIELFRNPGQVVSPEKARMVTDAVLNKCDTLKEGFLNNPRACTFDFKTLACSAGGSGASCLTPGELKTVETHYNGLRNSKGELIFSGQALGNAMPAQTAPAATGTPGGGYDTVRIWGFQNPEYDWTMFDLDRDMPIINSRVGFVDAVDPDLSAFKARGGKLLLYAGWGDTGITPENTVLYYDSVVEKMGSNQDDWLRLFMVPGMGHCGGGPGPNSVDWTAALDRWRASGEAPAQLRGRNPQTGLERPICPYPQYARYSGSGSVQDASNWSCAAP